MSLALNNSPNEVSKMSPEEVATRKRIMQLVRKYAAPMLAFLGLAGVVGVQEINSRIKASNEIKAQLAAATQFSNGYERGNEITQKNHLIKLYESNFTTTDSTSAVPSVNMMMDILPDTDGCSMNDGTKAFIPGFHRCPEGKGEESYSGTMLLTLPSGSEISVDLRSIGSDNARMGISPGQKEEISKEFYDWLQVKFPSARQHDQQQFIIAIQNWRRQKGDQESKIQLIDLCLESFIQQINANKNFLTRN